MTMLARTFSVTPQTSQSNEKVTMERNDGNNLDKDAFFKLLITQLRHQDPLKPMEDREFIAQMAEFSSLEQMANMNENLSTFMRMESLSQGAALIGRNVEYVDSQSGRILSGKVTKVVYESGTLYAHLDNDVKIPVDTITSIS
ncbi:flagellar hook assembly protein FlgD [Halothermothrix orenii]|uniref:Flagellar hook capping protein n=1 Tax=Halothermothrix orenii (strain H 168 / OCM 544 / DSM 9562) TaxID=373903 RepID=B8CYR3_HALOH|nr:flagellar hook assembly protein FlgD [Halothermothrix orenii]ACL70432.1 flagellar hook capping protein [Halothermothrix orenii H 168]